MSAVNILTDINITEVQVLEKCKHEEIYVRMNHLAKLYHMHTNTNASAELDS
jgi:hypothetical protein